MTAGPADPAPDRAGSSCAVHPAHPDHRSAESVRICVIRGFDSPLERDGSGNVVAGSTYGAAGLLSRGSVQYQFDHLGDATIRLDGSGNVLSYRLFDAWGNELTSGGEPYGYRARYGYYADAETGLVALAFRYYAPGVGRFVNRDPIGHQGGAVLYSYVVNKPVKHVDPDGRQWQGWVVAGGLVAAVCVSIWGTLHTPTPPVATKLFGACSVEPTGTTNKYAIALFCDKCWKECLQYCGERAWECRGDCNRRLADCGDYEIF